MKRDLRLMLLAVVPGSIPVVIGTCGGAGAEPHLQAVAELAREVAREKGLKFRMALIQSDQDPGNVSSWLDGGRITALRNVSPLTAATVQRSRKHRGHDGRGALHAGAGRGRASTNTRAPYARKFPI